MPQKDTTNNGSIPVDDTGIHRAKSITKSFKSLFTSNNNSSENLSGNKKDPSLSHIATLNNAALNNKEGGKQLKSQSSNDSSLESNSRSGSALYLNTSPSSPVMRQASPGLPSFGKNFGLGSDASTNNLIDQELHAINKNIINNPNSDINPLSLNPLSERSSSRGRPKAKSPQSIKSKDNSPQGSSREPSLSPQRSLKQYRNRGISVSQANFVHPHLAGSSEGSSQIKRSATLVKGIHHGDGKGIVVNNRHMIWESETFKLYRNFTHEHKLSALPLIDVNPDLLKDPEAMKEALEQRGKDAPAFSISTLFKLNKTSQQSKDQNDEKSNLFVHTSKGYIPSKNEIQTNNHFNGTAPHCKQVVKIDAYCSMKRKKNAQSSSNLGDTESNETGTPSIVNTKAAISKDELHLINDLTTRMKTIIDEQEEAPVATGDAKESEFVSKYGYCAGTLGQGSYGVVKVTCRKLKKNIDPETKSSTPFVIDNIAKKSFRFRDSVFFAVKELQADRKNVRQVDSDEDDTGDSSYMDYDSEADSDSKSTTLSDNIRFKLTKHRKRRNKDYNAKFCTRLTSEFVIGHALNNIGRHPNILKIFDLYQYDNIPNKFLQVMEFCPSGDLHSLIKRTAVNGNGKTISKEVQLPPIGPGPVFIGDSLNLMDGGTGFTSNTLEGHSKNEIPEKQKLSGSQQNLLDSLIARKQEKHTLLHPLEIDCFMKQIINGVAFMHEHGVAHCDLKPENILFKPNGILKLSDFGTSCVFQTAWEKKPHYQKGCFGSEPYMAPEQFIPHKQYDPRLVDTFAVGIIYVTMALGHYPWKSPIKEKDPDYADFVESLKVVIPYNAETKQQEIISGEYDQFEEMAHVNSEMKLLRKKCLYRMLHPNPNKRVLVKDVLNSNWMKRTHCCVIYRSNV